MIPFSEYTDARDLCTIRTGGTIRYYGVIGKKEDIREALDFSEAERIPLLVIGEGSNLIFADGLLNIIVLKMNIKGIENTDEGTETVDIAAGAGEIWDKLVEHTIDAGLSGLEALSAIPGSVGASPVQNIGAYGCEAGDTIVSVEVFDCRDRRFKVLSHTECRFGYRDSLFKKGGMGRYIITGVTFRLSKQPPPIPQYPDILEYFRERGQTAPTLSEIREAITKIRWSKLPDPAVIPNAGSFFKNPFVALEAVQKIKQEYPDARIFPVDDALVKIAAGWLIEKAGFKGRSFGKISVYSKNALVLINNGGATYSDLIKAKSEITEAIREKFGILLEQEPVEVIN
jgi:UDP-N-acetylmuramate dehydrogenase